MDRVVVIRVANLRGYSQRAFRDGSGDGDDNARILICRSLTIRRPDASELKRQRELDVGGSGSG